MPRSRRSHPDRVQDPEPVSVPHQPAPQEPQPGVLITFRPGTLEAGLAQLRNAAGMAQVAFAADFAGGAVDLTQTRGSALVVFHNLGVAVADMDAEQMTAMATFASDAGHILTIEPEPIFFALGEGLSDGTRDYLRGYRDAVEHLYQQLTRETAGEEVGAAAAPVFQDTAAAT